MRVPSNCCVNGIKYQLRNHTSARPPSRHPAFLALSTCEEGPGRPSGPHGSPRCPCSNRNRKPPGRGKSVLHVAGRTEASHARQKIPQPGNRASNLKLPLCDRLPIWSLNQGPLSITALSLDPFPLPMRHGSFETAENVSRHFYSLSHGIIGLPTVPSCSQGRCLYHWPRPLLGRPKPAGCVDCRASHQHR
jgi:hypothetical protein